MRGAAMINEGMATTLQAPAAPALVAGIFAAIRRSRAAHPFTAATSRLDCGRRCALLDRHFVRTQRIVLAMAEFGP
jgi:hypothetical protein